MKKGDKGPLVSEIQQLLASAKIPTSVDGDFGPKTEGSVKAFQHQKILEITGEIDAQTYYALAKYMQYPRLDKPQFAVFVDAGHGGYDKHKRKYMTTGKQWHHKSRMHVGGHYYEGWENRMVANLLLIKLAEKGILGIPLYHPVLDTPLRDRCDSLLSYLDSGFYGPLFSFHSNAVSMNGRTQETLDKIRGIGVYTTTKHNLSDVVATIHLQSLKQHFPDQKFREEFEGDKDGDKERNYMILRETEKHIVGEIGLFGAILEEFGFHTSEPDAKFIMASRQQRALAALRTIIRVRQQLVRKL